MTTDSTPAAAPAEFSAQVTIRRAAPGGSGAYSLVSGPLQTVSEAIALLEQLRDDAIAAGLVEIAPKAPADPTAAPADLAESDPAPSAGPAGAETVMAGEG